MADGEFNASPETLSNLVVEITKSIRNIATLNDTFLQDLKKLGNTFRDDGFDVVERCVKTAEKEIKDAIPDVEKVCKALREYARALYDARKA